MQSNSVEGALLPPAIKKALYWSIFFLLAIMVGLQIWSGRNLFGDAAHFFVYTLHEERFVTPLLARAFANYVVQWPSVLAIKLGIWDLDTLLLLQGLGLQGMPVLIWCLALFKLRNNALFWPFMLMFVVAYFNLCFFAISEANIAYALCGLCLAIILGGMKNGRFDYFLLFIAVFLLARSYEAAIFIIPFFCILAYLKGIKGGDWEKAYWFLLICVFAWGIPFTVRSIFSPQLYGLSVNAGRFLNLLQNIQIWICLLLTLWVSLGILVTRLRYRQIFYILAIFTALSLLIPSFIAMPRASTFVRAYMAIFIVVYGAFLSFLSLRIDAGNEKFRVACQSAYTAIPVFLLFAILLVSDMNKSKEYRKFIDLFRQEVSTRTGLVRFEDTALDSARFEKYFIMWTPPSFSLLLRRSEKEAIILPAEFYKEDWQPFDPDYPPDLRRYYYKGKIPQSSFDADTRASKKKAKALSKSKKKPTKKNADEKKPVNR
jgi:hypothetical protein